MKGAILILALMLLVSLAFSQQQEGAGEADSLKVDTLETDTSEADTLEVDTTKAEAPESDTLKADTSKAETPEPDTVEADTSKVETPEADTLKVDTLKVETPEADTLKADTLKVETPEADTLEVDTLKVETPEADTLEVDTLKVETPEADTLKVDTLKVETPEADTLKADTTTQTGPKTVVHKYVGTKDCRLCHNSVLKGQLYDKWAATRHATAYATLASEESGAIAQGMGIEDAQQDSTCLKCHVTGFGLPATDEYSMEEGVTCEACHGPGEHYQDIRVMTKEEQRLQKGFIVPDEKLCLTCHNQESPTYKEFQFKDAYEVIEHRTPEHEPEKILDLD